MSDKLAHYHMFDYRARCAVAVTTEIVREAQRRHDLDPITTIAVGRAISCAALLASTLKAGHREYVHCAFAGDGVLAKVIGECNGDGQCRGYALPAQILGSLNPGEKVPESVGEATGGTGILTVTRGVASEQTPYNAVSAFQDGEIAADIARYLTDSEQIPSAVAAGVKLSPEGSVLAAGGVLVQRLGGADLGDDTLTLLEQRMTQLHLSDRIAAGETVDQIVEFLQGEPRNFGVLMTRPLIFKCSCSRDKMADALAVLGEQQLREIQREVGKIEVRCQYCGDHRQFRIEELISH